MAFTGPVADRMEIRELYGMYADASARADRAAWLACWATDCRWTSHIFDCSGHAALGEQWDGVLAMFSELAFMSEVGAIEVAGDAAVGRSVAREIGRLLNGKLYKLVGCYEDRMVRENGAWLFTRRDYRPVIQEMPE